MKSIAIIPARSGSKGLKNKNIKKLAGKPLIAYTIEAAIESKCFDEIMVSTDSKEYAKLASQYGARVPFLRSEQNSSDDASSWDTVMEIIECYKKNNICFEDFCLLQPTSPLRDSQDIKQAYDLYYKKKANAVISVCETDYSPLLCGKLESNLSLEGFVSATNIGSRQSTGQFYRINGAIYIANIKEFERNMFLYRKGSYAYIMGREKSVDIDTIEDFRYAEILLGGVPKLIN